MDNKQHFVSLQQNTKAMIYAVVQTFRLTNLDIREIMSKFAPDLARIRNNNITHKWKETTLFSLSSRKSISAS